MLFPKEDILSTGGVVPSNLILASLWLDWNTPLKHDLISEKSPLLLHLEMTQCHRISLFYFSAADGTLYLVSVSSASVLY